MKLNARIIIYHSFLMLFFLGSCEELENFTGDETEKLTQSEIIDGLKTALKEGTRFAANSASQNEGYFNNPVRNIRIPLPEDVKEVESILRNDLGLGNTVDNFIRKMNEGASEAAVKAKPIFINAINNMSIQDARNILEGDSTAATSYLQNNTSDSLATVFDPVIDSTLKQVEATNVYETIASNYNTYLELPLTSGEPIETDLSQYVTGRALEGLFSLVAIEEKEIRKDPLGRSEEILRKVFGKEKE